MVSAGCLTVKNTLLVFLLTCIAAIASADDRVDSEYYVAIAVSEYGKFKTDKGYTYALGWHSDSMLDANQHAQTLCEWEASKAGTRCISSSAMLGGCIALAEGTLELEPDDSGKSTNWSRLFVASSLDGRSEADEAATQSCESITDGYNDNQIKSWNCQTVSTFCPSDVDESTTPAIELALEPLCDDEDTPEAAECWVKLLDAEDCFVWSTFNNRELFAALGADSVGSCPRKVLNGNHSVTLSYVNIDDEMRTEIYSGPWKNGKMGAGRWVDRNALYSDSVGSGYRNDQGRRIGEWTGTFEDRSGWKTQFRDGKRHGVAFKYWPSGVVYTKTIFVDDKEHGVHIVYFPDGAIMSETQYVEGSIHGVQIVRAPDGGERRTEIPYVNDKIHGTEKWFDGKGVVIRTVEYVDGEKVE